jgi:type VI protein secretion system component Hcp
MVDKPKTDTVMKFVLKGKPVFAECTLDVATGDTMMDGFRPAQPDVSTSYSNFFEVHGFDFAMSLKEGDTKEVLADTGAFAAWRSVSDTEYKNITYPLEFDKFTFKRTVDRASPIFFANCCASTSFDSATLVKRMSQGGDRGAMGFMRIDFTTVLLTGVDWSDGELVQESCDFICQKMLITMRQQLASGTISSSKYLITWDPENDRSKGIRTKYTPGG